MDDSTDLKNDQAWDLFAQSLMKKPKGDSLGLCQNGFCLINFTDARDLYLRTGTHQKLLLCFLLLALKDRATQLSFQPVIDDANERQIKVVYEVNGVFHPLVPPPYEVARLILPEITRLACLNSPTRVAARALARFANKLDTQLEFRTGWGFQMKANDTEINITVTLYQSPSGESVVLAFPTEPPALSELAHHALNTIFSDIQVSNLRDGS